MTFLLERVQPRGDPLDSLHFIVEAGSVSQGWPFPRNISDIGLRTSTNAVYPVYDGELRRPEWRCSENLVTVLESLVIIAQRQIHAILAITTEWGASEFDVQRLTNLAVSREAIFPRLLSYPALYPGFSTLFTPAKPSVHLSALNDWVVMINEVRQFVNVSGGYVWHTEDPTAEYHAAYFQMGARNNLNATAGELGAGPHQGVFGAVWSTRYQAPVTTRPDLLSSELARLARRAYEPQPPPAPDTARAPGALPENSAAHPVRYHNASRLATLDASWLFGGRFTEHPLPERDADGLRERMFSDSDDDD
jgi:hypothetical protein